jgi:hypothetical protein
MKTLWHGFIFLQRNHIEVLEGGWQGSQHRHASTRGQEVMQGIKLVAQTPRGTLQHNNGNFLKNSRQIFFLQNFSQKFIPRNLFEFFEKFLK